MRHRKKGRQLGRNTKHRIAMFRNLVTALLEHERIETTKAKAKELRGIADTMITLGKDGSLHARRRALSVIRTKHVVSKLFSDVAERFRHRAGGYTRIIPTRRRPGDAAELVAVELIERADVADDDVPESVAEDAGKDSYAARVVSPPVSRVPARTRLRGSNPLTPSPGDP